MCQIRPCQNEDAGRVAELTTVLGYACEEHEAATRLEQILRREDHVLLVAVLDAEVVGWVHAVMQPLLSSDPRAEIAGLIVDEARRGKGIGRRLVMSAREWAARHSAVTLRVRTRVEREATRRFYEKCGFEIVKTQLVLDLPRSEPDCD